MPFRAAFAFRLKPKRFHIINRHNAPLSARSDFNNLLSQQHRCGIHCDAEMKVFLDDVREAPPGWQRVYWPSEAIALLEAGGISEISLDHDLGDDARGTGYDVVAWIEEAVVTRGFKPPRITIHSANPVGKDRMLRGIAAIERATESNA
jgi:hypothetical protein